MDDKVKNLLDKIKWLGHASFKISGSKTVYFDPWKLPAGEGGDGDLVLVSHDHYDHCSPKDIKAALGSGGEVMAAECCREKYPDAHQYTLPYMKHKVNGIGVYAAAAYNINKEYHLREYGHVGYIVTIDGVKVYHTGDCDAFPHMRDLACDIVLLPVSGTYVMDPLEAVDACNMLNPQVAIPMHWGDPEVVGKREDAEKFKQIAPCEVVILEPAN